jgi:GcrA cell cycle regulator
MNALTLLDIRLAAEGAVAVHVALPDLREMQLTQAARLWADGKSTGEIAIATGVPVTTLRGWIAKHRTIFGFRRGDQAPPRDTEAETEAMLAAAKLWADGLSRDDIAAATGATKAMLIRWANSRRDLFAYRRTRRNGTVVVPPEVLRAERQPQQLTWSPPERSEFVAGIDAMPAEAARIPGPVRLLALSDEVCRWPLWSRDAEPGLFCGCRITPGRTYCDGHRKLAYQPAAAGKTPIRKGQ